MSLSRILLWNAQNVGRRREGRNAAREGGQGGRGASGGHSVRASDPWSPAPGSPGSGRTRPVPPGGGEYDPPGDNPYAPPPEESPDGPSPGGDGSVPGPDEDRSDDDTAPSSRDEGGAECANGSGTDQGSATPLEDSGNVASVVLARTGLDSWLVPLLGGASIGAGAEWTRRDRSAALRVMVRRGTTPETSSGCSRARGFPSTSVTLAERGRRLSAEGADDRDRARSTPEYPVEGGPDAQAPPELADTLLSWLATLAGFPADRPYPLRPPASGQGGRASARAISRQISRGHG